MRQRTRVCANCDLDKFRERRAHLADRDSHVLVGNRIEFRASLIVQRLRAFKISALSVQNRDRRLDQTLVEELRFTIRPLPDFFPSFMAFKEAPLVEQIDSLLVKICVVLHLRS